MLYLLLVSSEVKWLTLNCVRSENHSFSNCAVASALAAVGKTRADALFQTFRKRGSESSADFNVDFVYCKLLTLDQIC